MTLLLTFVLTFSPVTPREAVAPPAVVAHSRPIATVVGSTTPAMSVRALSGTASWFATGHDGMFAAAGPRLRAALGPGWRGDSVQVCAAIRCIRVTLDDWCLCLHRLIDLSDEAFRVLGPLSRGLLQVEIGSMQRG